MRKEWVWMALFLGASVMSISIAMAEHLRTSASASQLELIRQSMQDILKDADSAKFKDVLLIKDKLSDGSVGYDVCGEVNAKNSFGGYGGYQKFTSSLFKGTDGRWYAITYSVDSEDSPVAATVCKNKGFD